MIASRRAVLLLVALAAAGCVRPRPASHAVLRVGTSGDYAPFSVQSGDGFEGFDVEVARRFAHDTGRQLQLVGYRWPSLRADLAAGRFDVAMSGVTMRPERAVGAVYSRPVLATGAVALIGRHAATSAEQLDRGGMRIGVHAGGHLEWVARRLFPHATIQTRADNQGLPHLLDSGAVDAVLTDDVEATVFRRSAPWAQPIGPLTRDHKAYLGRDPALMGELDAWLRASELDGTLPELRGQWLGEGRAEQEQAATLDLEALLALIDLRLAFMPAIALAKERARLPVDDGAQEERVLGAVRTRAVALGLDPDSVAALFRAQIAAARAVQRRYLALPPARRPPVVPLDLDREARPAVAALSDAIVVRAAALADAPRELAASNAADVADGLDPMLASEADRMAIAEAVLGLRRAGGDGPRTDRGAREPLG